MGIAEPVAPPPTLSAESGGSDTLRARLAESLRLAPPAADARCWDGEPDGVLQAREVHTKRPAAVLVPIVPGAGGGSLLLTRRSGNLRQHSGQIAFPGGAMEGGDAGPAAAALRETEEEIGLEPSRVTVVGYLDPHLSNSGFRILPVVGIVARPFATRLNPREVDEIFEVPLAFLMDAANHRLASLERNGVVRHFYEMRYGAYAIWGVTAGIIRALHERLQG